MRKQESGMKVFDIWGQVTMPPISESGNPRRIRAHPRLDKFGPYYDWVDAKFEVEGSNKTEEVPVKLLAFYKNESGVGCAMVHSAEWSKGTESSLGNTRLIDKHYREFQPSGWPSIRRIKVSEIQRTRFVIERKKLSNPVPPQTKEGEDQKEYIVTVVKPRSEWASIFYKWAKNEAPPMFADMNKEKETSDMMNPWSRTTISRLTKTIDRAMSSESESGDDSLLDE
jgi:hypothetical protein